MGYQCETNDSREDHWKVKAFGGRYDSKEVWYQKGSGREEFWGEKKETVYCV